MSSKLSVRRATVRRPKICASAACPPPPPPVPWPPTTFLLTFEYHYDMWMPPTLRNYGITMTLGGMPFTWEGAVVTPDTASAKWELSDPCATADLLITGNNPDMGPFWLEKFGIPVNCGTPTPYLINTWDVFEWWMDWALASFTF